MSDATTTETLGACACCGGTTYRSQPVLWPALVQEWILSKEEEQYIDRQQGTVCIRCGNNLRSIALAKAILSSRNYRGTFHRFMISPRALMLRVLEINTAGTLTKYLRRIFRRTLAVYPEVDMQRMPYPSDYFDFVIHSDTLEHVPDPIRALSECLRVLKPGGFCCFTIPIIVGRLTRSRAGLPPSYHGSEKDNLTDFTVHTEYGSDFWTHLFRAGFGECRIVTAEFPSAQAIAAQKNYKS